MQGRTTFIIAHRLSTVRHAHEIVVLEQGRIVERGTHDELVRQQTRYADMYRRQWAGVDPDSNAVPIVQSPA